MRLLPLLLAQAVAKSKYDVVDRDDATTFGILIDAGSTGSRVHIYQWEKRDFNSLPPPLSLPLTSERWTERIKPGLSDYDDDAERAARTSVPAWKSKFYGAFSTRRLLDGVAMPVPHAPDTLVYFAHRLIPLIETAKRTLGNYKHAWSSYPIYVKATAGMRELPEKKRDATIDAVRKLLKDNSTCPFDFANKEQARVIAGEEEAAYAWVAVNFVDGALLVRDAAWHLRHLHESSPSSDDVGGLFFDFGPFRTASMAS